MEYSDVTREEIEIGKRASDVLNGIITTNRWDDIKHGYVAIRLSDGGSDGIVYDTKADAVKHQLWEQQCAYFGFTNLVGGASAKDCAIYLKFCRDAYAAGMRLVDPDNQRNPVRELLLPAHGFDQLRNNMNRQLAHRAMGVIRGR